MFLAGLAAARRLRRGGSTAELSRYLATRGLWLTLLEITVMRFALNFRFSPQDPVLLIILVALGLSMVGLAGLVWLPPPAIGAFGAAVVIGRNLLDPLRPADFGAWAPLWNLVHDAGAFSAAGQLVIAGYPVLPWAGLMALGFAGWICRPRTGGPAPDPGPQRAGARRRVRRRCAPSTPTATRARGASRRRRW